MFVAKGSPLRLTRAAAMPLPELVSSCSPCALVWRAQQSMERLVRSIDTVRRIASGHRNRDRRIWGTNGPGTPRSGPPSPTCETWPDISQTVPDISHTRPNLARNRPDLDPNATRRRPDFVARKLARTRPSLTRIRTGHDQICPGSDPDSATLGKAKVGPKSTKVARIRRNLASNKFAPNSAKIRPQFGPNFAELGLVGFDQTQSNLGGSRSTLRFDQIGAEFGQFWTGLD